MPKKSDVTITEIEEFEPSRVDGVGKGANGFPILMLKSIGGDVDTVTDMTHDLSKAGRPSCDTCEGSGKIMQGNRKCPDCIGTGKAPQVGESAKQFIEAVSKEEGVSASNAAVDAAGDCPTCKGNGILIDGTSDGHPCPDCGGTGENQLTVNTIELNAVAGDPGRISIGDPDGREKIDKGASGSALVASGAACPACKCMNKGDAMNCKKCGGSMTKGHGNDDEGFRPTAYTPDADETAQCPKCERMNDTDAAYCDQCGHELMGDDDVIVDGKPLKTDDDDTDTDDAEKAAKDQSVGGGVDRSKIPDEDHAGKNRSFPIVTPADVADTAASIGRAGDDNYSHDKIKSNIIAIANRKGAKHVAKLPDAWKNGSDATKAVTVADGATFTSMNPNVATPQLPDEDDDADGAPGSPAWEAVDAQTATEAAQALMQAGELIRTFAQRESVEAAVGMGNDVFDSKTAEMALIGVTSALGIMSQLAFHEGLEAQKSLEEGVAAKAGKRLSNRSIAALATARDHLNTLLGDDDPAKADDKGDGDENTDAVSKYTKSVDMALLSEEIADMTTEELAKVLDTRDERLVKVLSDVLKGESPEGAEVDAPVSDGEAVEASPEGEAEVEKAEEPTLTEEEIEARNAAKEAKKALKAARKAEREAAENAAVAKAIAEGVAEATEAVRTLQERLATVEKMAAPSSIVRTRPQEALTKSVERDSLEMRLAAVERVARETPDHDIRKAKREEADEIRNLIAGLSI